MSGVLRDERGALSSARLGMWVNLFFMYAYIVWTATPSPVVMSALSAVEMTFMGWAAGPRMMQYIGPAIGQVAQGISAARAPHPGMDVDERD